MDDSVREYYFARVRDELKAAGDFARLVVDIVGLAVPERIVDSARAFDAWTLSRAPLSLTPSQVAPFLIPRCVVAGVEAPEVLREGVEGSLVHTSIAVEDDEVEIEGAAEADISFKRRFGLPSSHWLTWLAKRSEESDSKKDV